MRVLGQDEILLLVLPAGASNVENRFQILLGIALQSVSINSTHSLNAGSVICGGLYIVSSLLSIRAANLAIVNKKSERRFRYLK